MSKSLPKRIEVKYTDMAGEEEKTAIVTKMPLGRYSQFFKDAEEIPQTVSEIAHLLFGGKVKEENLPDTEDPVVDFFLEIPKILTKHWQDLINLLSLASGVDKSELEMMDLDEASQVAMAVVEVNNFFGIKGHYQGMMTRQLNKLIQNHQTLNAPKAKTKNKKAQ